MCNPNHALSSQEVWHNARQGSLSCSAPSRYHEEEEEQLVIPDGVTVASELDQPMSSACSAICIDDSSSISPRLPPTSHSKLVTSDSDIFSGETSSFRNASEEGNGPQIPAYDEKLQQRILTLEKELRDRDLKCRLLEKGIQESEQRAILAEEGERLMSRRADIFGSIVAGLPVLGSSNVVEDTMSRTERRLSSEVARSRRIQRVRYNSYQVSDRSSISGLASPVKSDCQSATSNMDELVGNWHYGLRDDEAGAIAKTRSEGAIDEGQTVTRLSYNLDFPGFTEVVPSPSTVSFPALPSPVLSSRPVSLISSTSFSASWGLPAALGRTSLDGATQVTSPRSAPPSQPKRMRRFSSTSGGLKILILPNTKALPAASPSSSSRRLPHSKRGEFQESASSTACQTSHVSVAGDIDILSLETSKIERQHRSENQTTACVPLWLGKNSLISHLKTGESASCKTNDRTMLQDNSHDSALMATAQFLELDSPMLPIKPWLTGQSEPSSPSNPDTESGWDDIPPLFQSRLSSVQSERTCCHSPENTSDMVWFPDREYPNHFEKAPRYCRKLSDKMATGPKVQVTNDAESTAPETSSASSHLRHMLISDPVKATLHEQFCAANHAHSFTTRDMRLPDLDAVYVAIVSRLMTNSQAKLITDNIDRLTRIVASKLNNFVAEFLPHQAVNIKRSKTNHWQEEMYRLSIPTLWLVNNVVEKLRHKRSLQLRSLPWWLSYMITYHISKIRLYRFKTQS